MSLKVCDHVEGNESVGSLFSGIGGFDLGFEREGFKTSWFVENNPYCQAVLARHWPKVPCYVDITKLDFSRLPKVEVLIGGFPCQDISTAGKRKGIREGTRSSLWRYFAEAIRVLRPRVAVIENVPNLANLGLDVVLADIAQAGYDAQWTTLSAAQVGAIHKRERMFIFAYPSGLRHLHDELQERPAQGREQAQHESDFCFNPAYTGCNGTQQKVDEVFIADDWGERVSRFKLETLSGKSGLSRFKDVRSVEELFGRPDIPEPLVRRGGNGLSHRLDCYIQIERTKAVGNAVVPQVAQFIARQIKEVLARD